MTPQYILKASLCRNSKRSKWSNKSEEGNKKWAESQIKNLRWAEGYAEPGYTDPKKGVLFSDWNYFNDEVGDLLEKYGFGCEWEDEWDVCDDCNKAVRTNADSYFWQPYYVCLGDSCVCLDCLDKAEYLESIEDNPRKRCMSAIDPSKFGYELVNGEERGKNEYELGCHEGQNDDPEKILKALRDKGVKRVLFRLSETSQFYVKFEVWRKIEEELDEEEEEEDEDEVEEYTDEADHEPKYCENCDGPVEYMGTLGLMNWFKCRNCGTEQMEKVEAKSVKAYPRY